MLKVCVYITVYCIHMTGLDLLSLYDLSVGWFIIWGINFSYPLWSPSPNPRKRCERCRYKLVHLGFASAAVLHMRFQQLPSQSSCKTMTLLRLQDLPSTNQKWLAKWIIEIGDNI